MKKSYFLILLLFLISSLFIFNQNISYSNAQSDDIKYTFESDILYSGNGQFPNETYNLRNPIIYSQNYSATYSFENESIDTEGTNIGYIDDYNSCLNSYAKIKELIYNHRKILRFYDNNNTHLIDASNYFNNEVYGTIEFWLSSDDNNKDFTILFRDLNINVFGIKIENSYFKFLIEDFNGGWSPNIQTFYSNVWYHIRLDYDCRAGGGYQGLQQYMFHIYINNKLYYDCSFNNNQSYINKILFYTKDVDYNYSYYLDAIGYLWNSYSIKDNIIPITETNTSIQEIDKFEFAYDINGSFYPEGYDNPNTWTDKETGSYDDVNVYRDDLDKNDRVVKILHHESGLKGLDKEFSIEKAIIEINFSLAYLTWIEEADNWLNLSVYSYDSTLIVQLYIYWIDYTVYLAYWNGNNHINLTSFPRTIFENPNISKIFNFYINSNDNLCKFQFRYGNTFKPIFYFPLIEAKKGLFKIRLLTYCYQVYSGQKEMIDYIGVYINGSSLAEGFPYMICNLNSVISKWYLNHHNLFTINALGFFSFRVYDYYIGTIYSSDWITHNNTDILANLYAIEYFDSIYISYLFI